MFLFSNVPQKVVYHSRVVLRQNTGGLLTLGFRPVHVRQCQNEQNHDMRGLRLQVYLAVNLPGIRSRSSVCSSV